MAITSSPQVSAGQESQWTLETLRIYFDAIRAADMALLAERDQRFKAQREGDAALSLERDRRYREVMEARDMALKIKDMADDRALILARDQQAYRDSMHNGLISQLERERTEYARADEMRQMEKNMLAVIKPLADYITAQQGARRGFDQGRAILASIGGVILVVIAVATVIIGTRG